MSQGSRTRSSKPPSAHNDCSAQSPFLYESVGSMADRYGHSLTQKATSFCDVLARRVRMASSLPKAFTGSN